jgi:hypothetical protein
MKNLNSWLVGLAATAALSANAQYVPALTALEMSNAWSLSADVRGFYDDNPLTRPKVTGLASPQASWGTDLSPAAALNHSAENTQVSASYLFDARWYEVHNVMDYTHQANGQLQHNFGDNFKLSIHESFADAQEPTVIDPGIVTTPFRIRGNNIRNTAGADLTASLGKKFDLHLGYDNTLYAYQQTARSVIGYGDNFVSDPYLPMTSTSALSDRMEQLATAELQWHATSATTGILGYQFGHVDYTSPEYIIFPVPPYSAPPGILATTAYYSDIRNSDSHYGFAGVEENFTPELKASLRAGAEYLDYYNDHTTRLSPYVDACLSWQYLPGDSAQVGVKHVHNATDIIGNAIGNSPVLDEETTAVFISGRHNFSSRFTVTLTGQVQDSTFVDGGLGYDGKRQDFVVVELNLAYRITSWLLAETGYNYSRLTSDYNASITLSDLLMRDYTRNFGYLGLRGTFGK